MAPALSASPNETTKTKWVLNMKSVRNGTFCLNSKQRLSRVRVIL
jgi:hypothetical protein